MASSVEATEDLNTATKSPKTAKRKRGSNITATKQEEKRPSPKKRRESFTEIEFKVSLKDPNTCFSGLEKFIEASDARRSNSDSYDIIAHYCRSSPDCQEILQLLEAGRRKPAEHYLIFTCLEHLLLRLSEDDLPRLRPVASTIIRRLLAGHMGAIMHLLAMNNKSSHIKSSLRLLTAIVLHSTDTARQLQAQFDFQHPGISKLLLRTDTKDPQDVRTCVIHFMMAFLISGDDRIIRQLVETKGFLNAIFDGIQGDKLSTLQLLLPTTQEKIIENAAISKTSKIRLLNDRTLKEVAKLYAWRGPARWIDAQRVDEPEGNDEPQEVSEDRDTVRHIVHNFLIAACCSLKTGINFYDKTFGTSGKNHNHVITTVLSSLPSAYTQPLMVELVVRVLQACPDQLVWYLPSLQHSLTPRCSNNWLQAMELLTKVYDGQQASSPALRLLDLAPAQSLVSITVATLIPPREVWSCIIAALQHADGHIQYTALAFLHVILRRVQATLDGLHSTSSSLSPDYIQQIHTALTDSLTKVLPDLSIVFHCWNNILKPPVKASESVEKKSDEENTNSIPTVPEGWHGVSGVERCVAVMEVLNQYCAILPARFEDMTVDYSGLLEGVRSVCGGSEEQEGQQMDTSAEKATLLHLLLLKLLSQSNVQQLSWMKESVGGRSTLYLLLEMAITTASNKHLHHIACNLLQQLLSSTRLFDHTGSELKIWLEHLSSTPSSSTSPLSFLEHCLITVFKNPYPYAERVSDMVASTASLDIKGTDTTSVATTEALIDTIMLMDDEELKLDDGRDDHVITDMASVDYRMRFPFSPLVVVALEYYHRVTEDKKVVRSYLMDVIVKIFLHQVDPMPLCLLLAETEGTASMPRLVCLANAWLPSNLQMEFPVKSKKQAPAADDLESAISGALDLTDEDTRQQVFNLELWKSSGSLTADVVLIQTHKILLCLKRSCTLLKKDPHHIHVIEACFKTLLDVGIEISKSEFIGCSDNDGMAGGLPVGLSRSLLTQHLSHEQLATQYYSLILKHPELQAAFLWRPDITHKKSKHMKQLSRIITRHMAALVQAIPSALLSHLETDLSFFVTQISSLMKDLEDSDTKALSTEVLHAATGFLTCLSNEDFIQFVSVLCQMPSDQLTLQHGDMLVTALKLLVAKSSDYLERINYLLPLDVVADLWKLYISDCLDNLTPVMVDLLSSYPHFTHVASDTVLHHSLNKMTTESCQLAALMVAVSTSCRDWLAAWLDENNEHIKKPNCKQQLGPVVLQAIIHSGGDEKCLSSVRKLYWKHLTQWLLSSHSVVSGTDSVYTPLFSELIRNTAKPDKLQGLWDTLIEHLSTASEISDAQLMCAHSLTQQLSTILSDTEEGEDEDEQWMQLLVAYITALTHTLAAGNCQNRMSSWILTTTLGLIQDHQSERKKLLKKLKPIWNQFVRTSLRSLYKVPDMLKLLRLLVPSIYGAEVELSSQEGKDWITAQTLHTMLLSHSQCLPTMLQEGKALPVKDELVSLLLSLVNIEPACCQTAHVATILGAYGATLSTTDQKLLLMLQAYEKNDCPLSDYRPYLWGVKAVEHHAIRTNLGSSLWKQPSLDAVLDLIDVQQLHQSTLQLPLTRKLMVSEDADVEYKIDTDIYDPAFLLPLFSHLVAPESLINCRKFVDVGCLGYVFAALSSHDAMMRGAAYHILADFLSHLEGARRLTEKDQLLYLMNTVQNSIDPAGSKLAPIITVFLARVSSILLKPDHVMYQSLNSFLLLKPAIDTLAVPEFYKFFNSCSPQASVERGWILRLLCDGLRETADYRIFEKRYTFKILLSYHQSSLSDTQSQLQILSIVRQACKLRTVALDLVKHHGILTWLSDVIEAVCLNENTIPALVDALTSLWWSVLGRWKNNDSQHDHEKHRVLPIAFTYKMLHLMLELLTVIIDFGSMVIFSDYLKCILSVLQHLDVTCRQSSMASSDALPASSMSVSLQLCHVHKLLQQWGMLQKDSSLLTSIDQLASSQLVGKQRLQHISEDKLKRHLANTRRHKPLNETQPFSNAKGLSSDGSSSSGLSESCLPDLISVLCMWRPTRSNSQIPTIIFLINWALQQLMQYHSHNLGKFTVVLQWLTSQKKLLDDIEITFTDGDVRLRHFLYQVLLLHGHGNLVLHDSLHDGLTLCQTENRQLCQQLLELFILLEKPLKKADDKLTESIQVQLTNV